MKRKILCLSGGGFLGLYTASVLELLEKEFGAPIADYFDLIAGTSIGGIIALALAANVPAEEIAATMRDNGGSIFGDDRPASGQVAETLDLRKSAFSAKYRADGLKTLISDLVGEDTKIQDLKHRVLVPAVNLTKGAPQMFKTPHHPDLIRDGPRQLVDVALATSAAPTFFPIHTIDNQKFADGGMYANSPDLMALHEATHFLGASEQDVSILSIGTTSAKFSLAGSTSNDLGWLGWMSGQRLVSVMIASQQLSTHFMLQHKLGSNYFRIDADQSKEQERELSLDTASPAAISDLRGLADASAQAAFVKKELRTFFEFKADPYEAG